MMDLPDCGIYCIENMVTGYCYWGQSIQLHSVRLDNHRSALTKGIHDNEHMQRSFNKHGMANFAFKVILYCEPWELTRYEDALEKAHRPFNYNKRKCADSNKGIKYSDDVRHNMSLAHVGKPVANKGTKHTEVTKLKMREAWKKRVLTPVAEETKHKISVSLIGNARTKGHKASEETKSKLSEQHKGKNTGKKLSEETKRKISVALVGNKNNKGHKVSKRYSMPEEQKHKISLANSGLKRSEEFKRRMSVLHTGHPWSEARRTAYEASKKDKK